VEDPSIDIVSLVEPYLGILVIALGVLVLILLLGVLALVRRTRGLVRRLDGLTRGADGRSLEAVLDAHLDTVFAVARDLDEVSVRTALLEATTRRSFQRVSLVRFNPFEDTGGNQSFALALLDARGSGLVLSSLHSRSGTRVYAKAVVDGRSEAALSEEETTALRDALAQPAERPGATS
jgi:hypothetical protein